MKLPKQPVIETERLVLRLVEKGDLPALFVVNSDRKVFRYSPRVHWKTPSDGRAWFSRIMTHRKNGATIQFVIVLRESGLPIGTFAVFNFDESVGSAEVGYVLGWRHWGKGLIKETLAAFVPFAFETLKLKRLEAELDPRNLASAKALVRVGFSHEGCRRSNYFSKGEITDTGLYGMLNEDPRPDARSVGAQEKRMSNIGLNGRRPHRGWTAGSRRRSAKRSPKKRTARRQRASFSLRGGCKLFYTAVNSNIQADSGRLNRRPSQRVSGQPLRRQES